MSRIYAPVDEPTLEQIDQDAKEKGISRAQWVSTAIESILHQEGGNIENLRLELEQARTEREETWRELVQLRRTQEQSSTDIEQLRSKLTKLQEDKSPDGSRSCAVQRRAGAVQGREKKRSLRL